MYYLYILRSSSYNKFYVGITDNPDRRLREHNQSLHNTFTSKYRPWELYYYFEVGEDLGKAMKVERKVKKQKNCSIYEKLKDEEFRKGFLSSVG